jgi:N-acetylneuraminic acid mutarotase
MKKIGLSIIAIAIALLSQAQLGWLKMADFPGTGVYAPVSFSINGKGYMGLGLNATGSNCPKDWYEYNPANNTWTKKADFPGTGRYTAVSFVIGGKAYVVTGSNTSGLLDQTYEYEPTTDTWTAKANFPGGARQNAAGFAIGNKGYVGTGYSSGASYSDFYEYNPATNQWTKKADVPGPARNTGAGFSIGSKGYIGLGNSTNSVANFNDIYEYDTTSNSWTQKASLPFPLCIPTAYSNSGSAYLLGGYYYQTSGITHNPMNTLFKFDQAGNTWTLEGTFCGLPRGYAGGFSLSNDLYFGAGAYKNSPTTTSVMSDFWKLSNGLTLLTGDVNSDTDFKFYPNPATGTIFIEADKNAASIRVFDISGRITNDYTFDKYSGSLDISNLSNGLYFVEITTKEGEVMDSKFIKQ